jgi:hypothetical protein
MHVEDTLLFKEERPLLTFLPKQPFFFESKDLSRSGGTFLSRPMGSGICYSLYTGKQVCIANLSWGKTRLANELIAR